MVAVPWTGTPAITPLHTTNVESHWPPQTAPAVETVATFVLLYVKVVFAATGVPAEFSVRNKGWATSPALSESVDGVTVIWVTVLFTFDELPPQPATTADSNRANPVLKTKRRMRPPRPDPAPGGRMRNKFKRVEIRV